MVREISPAPKCRKNVTPAFTFLQLGLWWLRVPSGSSLRCEAESTLPHTARAPFTALSAFYPVTLGPRPSDTECPLYLGLVVDSHLCPLARSTCCDCGGFELCLVTWPQCHRPRVSPAAFAWLSCWLFSYWSGNLASSLKALWRYYLLFLLLLYIYDSILCNFMLMTLLLLLCHQHVCVNLGGTDILRMLGYRF